MAAREYAEYHQVPIRRAEELGIRTFDTPVHTLLYNYAFEQPFNIIRGLADRLLQYFRSFVIAWIVCWIIYQINCRSWQNSWIDKYGRLALSFSMALLIGALVMLGRYGQQYLVHAADVSYRLATSISASFNAWWNGVDYRISSPRLAALVKLWLVRVLVISSICLGLYGMIEKARQLRTPQAASTPKVSSHRTVIETITAVRTETVTTIITTTQFETVRETQTAFVTVTALARRPIFRAVNNTTPDAKEPGLRRRNIKDLLKEEKYALMSPDHLSEITGPMVLKTVGYRKRHLDADSGYCHVCRQEHSSEVMMAEKELRYENEWVYV